MDDRAITTAQGINGVRPRTLSQAVGRRALRRERRTSVDTGGSGRSAGLFGELHGGRAKALLASPAAAKLNPDVEAARSVLEFEDFLFGRDRVALERIAEGLLDLQHGGCFYCRTAVGRSREIDHFIPWTCSGDNGLDNLVDRTRRIVCPAYLRSPDERLLRIRA
jgi:hypothetical protein